VILRADSALCRYRHNADYAEVLVMPMCLDVPLLGVGDGPCESA
jgi:hypothetical protein